MHATVEHDRACAAGHGARQTRVVLRQACLNASEASSRRGTHVDIASTERKEEFGQVPKRAGPEQLDLSRDFADLCRLDGHVGTEACRNEIQEKIDSLLPFLSPRRGLAAPPLLHPAWSAGMQRDRGGGMDSVPRMDSGAGSAAAPCPPKGPAGMSFVALPAPIASTLPAPVPIEPLLGQTTAEREALIASSQERRRELTEAGQILNRVVYDSMVFVPGSADRVPGGALLFESRFESGNLRRAVHVNGNEYDLLLNWDHGTRGHTQWYFFSVSNAHAGESYKFNIVNFCKPQSL